MSFHDCNDSERDEVTCHPTSDVSAEFTCQTKRLDDSCISVSTDQESDGPPVLTDSSSDCCHGDNECDGCDSDIASSDKEDTCASSFADLFVRTQTRPVQSESERPIAYKPLDNSCNSNLLNNSSFVDSSCTEHSYDSSFVNFAQDGYKRHRQVRMVCPYNAPFAKFVDACRPSSASDDNSSIITDFCCAGPSKLAKTVSFAPEEFTTIAVPFDDEENVRHYKVKVVKEIQKVGGCQHSSKSSLMIVWPPGMLSTLLKMSAINQFRIEV